MNLHVYVCTDFKGVWPVGTAAVVVAQDHREARKMLLKTLEERGLPQSADIHMHRIYTAKPEVVILADGNY